MLDKNVILRVAKLRQQEKKLRDQLEQLREKAKLPGTTFGSWYGWDDGSIGMEIPIPDYLRFWPDAQPVAKSYVSTLDGKLHVWSEWPWQHAGNGLSGTNVWVKAETKAQAMDVPEIKPAPAVETNAEVAEPVAA